MGVSILPACCKGYVSIAADNFVRHGAGNFSGEVIIGMLEDKNHAFETAPEGTERKGVQNDKNFEPLLDTDEAARLLRIHPRTLRTKARIGSIPGVQVGRRWRFRASTLNRWLGKLAS